MSTMGIIGSGNIGSAVARLAVAADIDVVIANSRGPHSLAALVEELGPRAGAATVEQAARASGPPRTGRPSVTRPWTAACPVWATKP